MFMVFKPPSWRGPWDTPLSTLPQCEAALPSASQSVHLALSQNLPPPAVPRSLEEHPEFSHRSDRASDSTRLTWLGGGEMLRGERVGPEPCSVRRMSGSPTTHGEALLPAPLPSLLVTASPLLWPSAGAAVRWRPVVSPRQGLSVHVCPCQDTESMGHAQRGLM